MNTEGGEGEGGRGGVVGEGRPTGGPVEAKHTSVC